MRRFFTAVCVTAMFLFTAMPLAYADEIYAVVPTFEDFPAVTTPVDDLVSPILMPGSPFWEFHTAIREGSKENGVNFDGAFTLVSWGCGTECQSGVIVDRTDGKIYGYLPVTSAGYSTTADSSLLIVNAYISELATDGVVPDWAWREFWDFQHGTFHLVYRDKGDVP